MNYDYADRSIQAGQHVRNLTFQEKPMFCHLNRAEWLLLATAVLGGVVSGAITAVVTLLLTHL